MATITAIREALAASLDAHIDDVQVSAYMLANPTPPCLQVFPGQIEYDLTMRRGADTIDFTVQAFVPFATDIGSQKKLDELLAPSGAGSVKAALEVDKTQGGVVQDTHVENASGYRVYTVDIRGQSARGPVLGCTWSVSVIS